MFTLLPALAVLSCALPFAPLSDEVLGDSDLPAVLSMGDLVFARPDIKSPRRAYTGIALVSRSCADVHAVLQDPSTYPRVYPMITRVIVSQKQTNGEDFTMRIVAGPGSAERKCKLRRHPGRVLTNQQSVGNSTWHFFGLGAGSCIIHFTHDEDFTADSMILRMALRKKQSIVEGMKAAAAVANVGNVRRYFERGSVARPRRTMGSQDPAGRVPNDTVLKALARLSKNSTVAFMSRDDQDPVWVATRVKGPRQKIWNAVSASETWRKDIGLLYSTKATTESDGSRKIDYTLESIFEELDFSTHQTIQSQMIQERVVDGELDSGGWSWRVVESPPDRALFLSLGLHLEQGDWLVEKLSKTDRSAADGTALGIAFRLVDGIAERVDKNR